jgi:tetratricopeptide (TPR) repeat protein
MRAGAVAEEVFAANPMHPGAAHYLYDDPVHAPLGLRAARVYAKIAPAASHAQHMISHIYMALGDWPASVSSNEKAIAVAGERRQRRKLGPDAENYHALHWLQYSFLQLGRFEEARALLDRMGGWARESGSPRALWHLAAMRAAWTVETRRPAPGDPVAGKVQLTGVAGDLFATGYAAVLAGRIDAARDAATQINARTGSAAASGHVCEQTGGYQDTSKSDLVVAEVMQKSLLALVAASQKDTGKALSLMDEATAAEDALPIDFGPPQIVKPSHEIYGEMLLEMGRPADARVQFERALARAPRRSLSLAGLARTAQVEGLPAIAARACSELSASYAGADASVPMPSPCVDAPGRAAKGGGSSP